MKMLAVGAGLLMLTSIAWPQSANTYDVYAIRFAGPTSAPASEIAVGANSKDSVRVCNMIWFLNGANRKILVDTGFVVEDATNKDKTYIRPDKALLKLNVNANEITDVIVTHPHYDHIDGIDLFPKAQVWMQKDDYDYFVGAAWQKTGFTEGLRKEDVRKIVEINLQGRLTLVKGDNFEIIPGIKVFTGSKHTWESQYLLVDSKTDKVLLASDAIWFYYNFDHMLPIPKYTFDANAYVQAMRRMTTLVSNPSLIIPGHDDTVFERFSSVAEGIVKIR